MPGDFVQATVGGLYTNGNFLSAPPGSLETAINVVSEQPGSVRTRKGFKKVAGPATFPSSLVVFNDNLVRFGKAGDAAYYAYPAGPWVNFSASVYGPTDFDSGARVRGEVLARNLYFNTSAGIYRLSSVNNVDPPTVYKAGVPKALDTTVTTTGASGFLANNQQAAYRVVWAIYDEFGRLILGAPSGRSVIINTAGGTRNVQLQFSVPDGITAEHIYQVYRSAESGGAAVEPSDELQLVYEDHPSASFLVAKIVTITDTRPNTQRGATLYTSPSQQGIAAGNEPPPLSRDLVVFKSHLFYLNTTQDLRAIVQLKRLGAANSGLNNGTFTATTTNGSPTLTVVSSTTGLAIGQVVTGTGVAANTYITAINAGASTVTMNANATANGAGITITFREALIVSEDPSSATPATAYLGTTTENIGNREFQIYTAGTELENIRDTARSIARVVNRYSGSTYNCHYISDTAANPGLLLFERGDPTLFPNSKNLYVRCSNGLAWEPTLDAPFVSVTNPVITGGNDRKPNGLAVSKPDQPDAVPLAQTFFAGRADKSILRGLVLGESLILCKEDGFYRLTGEDIGSFRVDVLDSTVRLWAPNTAVVLGDHILALTDRGIRKITASGVSRDPALDVIDDLVQPYYLGQDQTTIDATKAYCWAVEKKSSAEYWLVLSQGVSEIGEPVNQRVFVWNIRNQTWHEQLIHNGKALLHGAIASLNQFFLAVNQGAGPDTPTAGVNTIVQPFVSMQRTESGPQFDHGEDEATFTISSIGGTDLTVTENPALEDVQPGDLIVRGNASSYVTAVAQQNDYGLTAGTTTNANNVISNVTLFDDVFDGALIRGPGIPAATTISSHNIGAGTITLSANATATQNNVVLIITASPAIANILTVESTSGFTTGSATLTKALPVTLQWLPQHAGNPAQEKQFSEVTWLFRNRQLTKLTPTFRSDVYGSFVGSEISLDAYSVPAPVDMFLHKDAQQASQLTPKLYHRRAREYFILDGFSLEVTPYSGRVRP